MTLINRIITAVLSALLTASCLPAAAAEQNDFEKSVADYTKKFPYQDTYNYLMQYTGGDASKLNTWVLGEEPALVKAGEDKVVRMNNDTYYKMAFFQLDDGAVILESSNPSKSRFSSFQLMDDHNVNYQNIIYPDGKYTLYYGNKPEVIQGTAIEVPSALSLVIVRVEVKDKNNAKDVADAKNIFNGITTKGPVIMEFPKLDLLSSYDEKVATESLKRIDEVSESTDFSKLIAGSGDVPEKVSYLQLAAGTKGGWGGPVTSHSAYELIYLDGKGEEMHGSKGTYTITTKQPPVDAFWSVTAYDTARGGFFHPNSEDRYHINNTSAVKNTDGSFTFTFKQACTKEDINCLEVPAGRFDYTIRYYLPGEAIRDGSWRMSKAALQK